MQNSNNVPQSVGLIMDGNGRWMQKQGRSRLEGHTFGIVNMTRLTAHMLDRGVRNVVCYGLSTENLKRPKPELEHIYQLVIDMYDPFIEMMTQKRACVKFVGNLSALPESVQKSIARSEQRLSVYRDTGKCVYVGIAYGARYEMVQAIQALQEKEGLSEQSFLSELSVPVNLDLIIRTGGEYRLSNFMLYQAAYAELYFSEKLFPEFTAQDVDDAFAWYATRTRRFGRLQEQDPDNQ